MQISALMLYPFRSLLSHFSCFSPPGVTSQFTMSVLQEQKGPEHRSEGKVPGCEQYSQYLSNSARPSDPNRVVTTCTTAPLISYSELCHGLATP